MPDEERYEKLDRLIEAIGMHLKLTASMVQAAEVRTAKCIDELLAAIEQDSENIRALAHIAETHGRRN